MPQRRSNPTHRQPVSGRAGRPSQPASGRADKLARARQLVRDPNYPSSQVIQAVAHTLARQWTRPQTTGKAAPSPKARPQA